LLIGKQWSNNPGLRLPAAIAHEAHLKSIIELRRGALRTIPAAIMLRAKPDAQLPFNPSLAVQHQLKKFIRPIKKGAFKLPFFQILF